MIELPRERTSDEMHAPKNNWSWCSGAIVHFDMKKDLRNVVVRVAREIGRKKFKSTPIHSCTSDHNPGWEDYSMGFLTAKVEKNWELSGKFFRFRCPN